MQRWYLVQEDRGFEEVRESPATGSTALRSTVLSLADFYRSSREFVRRVLPQTHGKLLVGVLRPLAWCKKTDVLNDGSKGGATPERQGNAEFLQ